MDKCLSLGNDGTTRKASHLRAGHSRVSRDLHEHNPYAVGNSSHHEYNVPNNAAATTCSHWVYPRSPAAIRTLERYSVLGKALKPTFYKPPPGAEICVVWRQYPYTMSVVWQKDPSINNKGMFCSNLLDRLPKPVDFTDEQIILVSL